MNGVEILGYVATVLVLVGMLMGSVVRLRILNGCGAACFAVYGWLVGSTPLVITNVIIVFLQIWKLTAIARHEVDLAVVEAAGPDAPMVRRFLQVHGAEMDRTHPGFDPAAHQGLRLAYVLRNAAVAGLFAWTEEGRRVTLHLDYVLPAYRDLRCAALFLEHQADGWREAGLDTVAFGAAGQVHRDLRRGWGLLAAHTLPGGLQRAEFP
jgi:hypothetical protein